MYKANDDTLFKLIMKCSKTLYVNGQPPLKNPLWPSNQEEFTQKEKYEPINWGHLFNANAKQIHVVYN